MLVQMTGTLSSAELVTNNISHDQLQAVSIKTYTHSTNYHWRYNISTLTYHRTYTTSVDGLSRPHAKAMQADKSSLCFTVAVVTEPSHSEAAIPGQRNDMIHLFATVWPHLTAHHPKRFNMGSPVRTCLPHRSPLTWYVLCM